MSVQKNVYFIEHMQKFRSNMFIHQRSSRKQYKYSYIEIITQVKNVLLFFEKHGIPKKTGIALSITSHTPASCVILLGVLNYGCHLCPIELNLSADELKDYIKKLDVNFLITDNFGRNLKIFETVELNVLSFKFYCLRLSDQNEGNNVLPSTVYAITTSGSTGDPKIVFASYSSIEPNIRELSKRFNITSSDKIYLGTPMTFDPFFVEFFLALYNGATLLLTSVNISSSAIELLNMLLPKDDVHLNGVTVLQMTPSLFRMFGADTIKSTILCDSSTLRILILGGEQFPNYLELRSWLPVGQKDITTRIFNIYGITELSCWSTIHEILVNDVSSEFNKKCIPLGTPIDNETVLYLIDEKGNTVNGEGTGEMVIGSSTRLCYIPELDGRHLSKEILFRHTGDIIERDKHGNLYFVGRINRSIKRYGKRINLDNLDKKINSLIAHKNIISYSLWDEDSLKLILYVATNSEVIENFEKIRVIVLENLLSYEKPDKILYIKSIPFNKHGKADLQKLQRLYKANYGNMKPNIIFNRFLTDILGIKFHFRCSKPKCTQSSKRQKKILDATFRELGGTSFQALSLTTEIGRVLTSPTDQTNLLQMLMDGSHKIHEVQLFLENVAYCTTQQIKQNNLHQSEHGIKLKLVWRVDLEKCVDASPSIYGQDFICVGSHANLLCTLCATSGKEIARIHFPKPIECKVEYVSSSLALVGCSNVLYAFNFKNGNIIWNLDVQGLVKAKPLNKNSFVIICSYGERFNTFGICLKTRQIVWQKKIGEKGILANPVGIDQKKVLVCTLDGTYALANFKDGAVIWERRCDSPIFSTPAYILGIDKFAVAEVSGHIHVCNVCNGSKLTTFDAAGMIFSSITTIPVSCTKHLLVFGSYDHCLYCLEFDNDAAGKNLNILWKADMNDKIYTSPISIQFCQNNYALCCTISGKVSLVNLENGVLTSSYDLYAQIFSSPCVTNDHKVYFGSRDNHVYCLQLEQTINLCNRIKKCI